ncbi:zinc finger protein 708-like [Aricia agestis]|uniref:zinc finger protein 708-like n=1 Tax=Aricia agestis TaxID=91739 RepID=UPI001C2089F2|nr:zinc finger protein 708-like [Aricia agestis]
MVTSYYMMKLSANKSNIDFNKHFVDVYNKTQRRKLNKTNSCRVCSKTADITISECEHPEEIAETLRTLGDIELTEDDPKHLCKMCYEFVKAAILFRKVANITNETLKQTKELPPQSDGDDYNDNDYMGRDSPDYLKDIKIPEVDPVKLSAKVQCEVCNKVLTRTYYKEHMTMHDPNHHKYVCDVCGKSFRLRCAYHNHSLRHGKDFPFKCQFCPYRGRYAELLKTHMRTHTGDYRYMCTECPARFLFKSNLNTHMFKHKEPQFKCDSCKRAFHTQRMLKSHYDADHLGIKNDVCNMCGKAFGYRKALMKHQRHVHKREKISFGRMPAYLKEQMHSGNT